MKLYEVTFELRHLEHLGRDQTAGMMFVEKGGGVKNLDSDFGLARRKSEPYGEKKEERNDKRI